MKHFAIAAIFAFVLTIIFSVDVLAAPPANDNFANAQVISGLSGTITGTTAEATKQAGELPHAWNLGGRSVWYKYTAPGNGVMTLDTASSGFDTLMAVYQGSSLATLKLVAANDRVDFGSFNSSLARLTFGTVAGTDYYIAIDGYNSGTGAVQNGALQLSYQLTPSHECDMFGANPNYCTFAITSGTKLLTLSNIGASKESGEPNHSGNPGGRSLWYHLSAFGDIRSYTFTLEAKAVGNPSTGIPALIAIYQGSNLGNLVPVTSTVIPADHTGRLTLHAAPGQSYYVAIDGYDAGGGAATGNFLLTYGPTVTRKQPDFDRDAKADLTVYRPQTGTWYSSDSVTGNLRAFVWGANGDKPMLNHWDDDDRPDYSVFRPDTQIWYPYQTRTQSYTPFSWGLDTDIPLTLNRFNQGTSSTYAAVFRRATGTWWINTAPGVVSFQFGQNGDYPITADFDGDGTDETAVFRPSNGVWYFGDAFTGAYKGFQQFGANGDLPVPADYDGDGRADIAVFRPSTGTWYILQSANNSVKSVQFGAAGDKPQPGVYDDFGLAQVAVFRPSTGVWYILSFGGSVRAIPFGQNGDIPMVAPLYTN